MRSPNYLRALAALTEAAAIKNRRFVDDLHGMGRRDEAAIWERRVEAQEAQACALREEAAQTEASDGVRASILETVQMNGAA